MDLQGYLLNPRNNARKFGTPLTLLLPSHYVNTLFYYPQGIFEVTFGAEEQRPQMVALSQIDQLPPLAQQVLVPLDFPCIFSVIFVAILYKWL